MLLLCIFIVINTNVSDRSAVPAATESIVVDDKEVADSIPEGENMSADLDEQADEIESPVLRAEGGECTSGNICVFGSYQLDDQQGKDSLEWIILKKSGDKIFVLSRYLLREQVSFGKNTNRGKMVGVAWEKSYLRNWLNDSFYNEAFTQEQKDAICVTTLGFEYTGTYQGICQDKVFCLGVSEAENYKDFLKTTFYGSETSTKRWLGSI